MKIIVDSGKQREYSAPMMNLHNATVVGFFSLPSPSLAEANLAAYSAAMSEAPQGAGSCAHCGTGILHHVVIRVDGQTAFIGTSCAEKVGSERVRQCVRERMTDEQIATRDAERERKAAARKAADDALIARVAAERAARAELFGDVLSVLNAQNTDFHSSLAAQLADGPLSDRQATYVCKAMFGRYSKRVAAEWDEVYERITEEKG